jgi:hypothetical protein
VTLLCRVKSVPEANCSAHSRQLHVHPGTRGTLIHYLNHLSSMGCTTSVVLPALSPNTINDNNTQDHYHQHLNQNYIHTAHFEHPYQHANTLQETAALLTLLESEMIYRGEQKPYSSNSHKNQKHPSTKQSKNEKHANRNNQSSDNADRGKTACNQGNNDAGNTQNSSEHHGSCPVWEKRGIFNKNSPVIKRKVDHAKIKGKLITTKDISPDSKLQTLGSRNSADHAASVFQGQLEQYNNRRIRASLAKTATNSFTPEPNVSHSTNRLIAA